jgi:hypothetical protein
MGAADDDRWRPSLRAARDVRGAARAPDLLALAAESLHANGDQHDDEHGAESEQAGDVRDGGNR